MLLLIQGSSFGRFAISTGHLFPLIPFFSGGLFFQAFDSRSQPAPDHFFDHVYAEPTPRMVTQRAELRRRLGLDGAGTGVGG